METEERNPVCGLIRILCNDYNPYFPRLITGRRVTGNWRESGSYLAIGGDPKRLTDGEPLSLIALRQETSVSSPESRLGRSRWHNPGNASGGFFHYGCPSVYIMDGFEEIYGQHFGAVFRYALHCVGRRELAEDLTSEAFLALYQHWNEIDRGQLPGWLITVVKNRAIDHWRRASREELYADPPAEAATDFDSRLGNFLLDEKSLKPLHRVCLILRYVHGMTREEIARKLGMTDNQVKGTLQYALELLRLQSAKPPRKSGHE